MSSQNEKTCKICGKLCKNSKSFTTHLQFHHKDYNTKKYYDEFLKKENEGICEICGKETKFLDSVRGYNRFCSKTCAWKCTDLIERRRNTISKASDEDRKEWIERRLQSRKENNNGKMLSSKILEKRNSITKTHFSNYLKKCHCTLIEYVSKAKVVFRCEECGNTMNLCRSTLDRYDRNNDYTICNICNAQKYFSSASEKEIVNFIMTFYDEEILVNTRKIIHGELDIYIPEKKLAIEFDGLYWHNDDRVDENYHLTKTQQCEKQGIHLIHIFEDEWLYKKNIVKNKIRSLFGKNERVFARKTECREISYEESEKFLNENHIQGNCVSKYRYGLFYNNELVSVMTFGESRFVNEFELLRFASKLCTNVIGGASKLVHHFAKEHHEINEIVCNVDRRWSNGNLYEKLGFTKYTETETNVWNIISQDGKRIRTHSIENIGMKIHDCGNIIFRISYAK